MLKCCCKGRKQATLVGVAGLIAERMPAEVLMLEGGQDHKTAETDVIKCTVRDVAQKWRRADEGTQQCAPSPPTCRNSKKLLQTHMQSLLTNIVKPVTCAQCLSAIVSSCENKAQ